MQGKRTGLRLWLLAVTCLALSACTSQYRSHGYVPSEAELQEIVVGVDTRATVEDTVGVPSAAGVLNSTGFYYIQSEMRHFGWRKPEVVDREVLAMSFDEAGVLRNIERYGLQDGQVVPIARRVTRSGDADISFIRKLFGNIGRFAASDILN